MKSLSALPRALSVAFVFVVSLWCGLLLWCQAPPSPRSAKSSPKTFSAHRAAKHLPFVAKVPHPIGTKAHQEVRRYLLTSIRKLGFTPQLQRGVVDHSLRLSRWRRYLRGAPLTNVFVHIKGKKSTGIVAVVSHYDSVRGAPGAGDDGAAVVAMLELMRAVRAHPPMQNDLLFLFTDGEEGGLLGAQLFMKKHPLAKKLGFIMNFEGRGNSGPGLMFETTPGNAKVIAEFARVVPSPRTNSLAYEIYKLLPNDTDFSVFRRANIPGVNIGLIQGVAHYHKPTDTIENLSLASLQHHGEYMLSMVRGFGQRDLRSLHGKEAVFFDVFGLYVLHYSVMWAWIWSLLGIFLLGVIFWKLWKAGDLRPLCLCIAMCFHVVVWVVVTLLIGGLGYLLLMLKGKKLYAFYYTMRGEEWIFAGCMLLTWGLTTMLWSLGSKIVSTHEEQLGVLCLWTLPMLASCFVWPGASYLFTWPLLLMSVLFLVELFRDDVSHLWQTYIAGLAGEILLMVLCVPLLMHIFYGMTFTLVAVTALFCSLFVSSMPRSRHVFDALVGRAHRLFLVVGSGAIVVGLII